MIVELVCGDRPEPWAALGFGDPALVGGVRVRLDGRGGGLRSWILTGSGPDSVDGIPTVWTTAAPGPPGGRGLDHLVILTDSLDRTVDALVAIGGDERRRMDLRGPMSFVRLGAVILEIVESGGPTRLWGLVAVVPDLSELPAGLLGPPRDAVQPGRRIATAKPAAGFETALAFMTPRPGSSPPSAGQAR